MMTHFESCVHFISLKNKISRSYGLSPHNSVPLNFKKLERILTIFVYLYNTRVY